MTLSVIGFFVVLFLQIGLLVALVALNISLLSFALSWLYDVPFVATPSHCAHTIGSHLEIHAEDIVYDIGCGDGRILFALSKLHPESTYIGIERNPLLISLARIRALCTRTPNVTFRREDARGAELRDATKVYTYLSSPFMRVLYPAIKNSPSITHMVSRAYPIPEETPDAIIELDVPRENNKHLLYLYRFER